MADGAEPLLAHHRDSFEAFTQSRVEPALRALDGLEAILREVFPIRGFDEVCELSFVRYRFGDPSDDPRDCLREGTTYARTLWLTLLSIRYDVSAPDARSILDMIEEEVACCELPWMTDEGTFIVDGVERAVLPQLARAPGVWFAGRGSELTARVEPVRGPRVDVRLAKRPRLLQARVGPKGRWIAATTLARALGLSREALLKRAYGVEALVFRGGSLRRRYDPALLLGSRAWSDVVHGGELLVRRHRKFTRAVLRALAAAGVTELPLSDRDVEGMFVAEDVVDEETGEVVVGVGEPIEARHLAWIRRLGIAEVAVLPVAQRWSATVYSPVAPGSDALILETEMSRELGGVDEACVEVMRSVRPIDEFDPHHAATLTRHLFEAPRRFDLTSAGRARMNRLLGTEGEARGLSADDVVATLVGFVRRRCGAVRDLGDTHLSNAVVRGVGALLEQVVRRGFEGVELGTRERLSLVDPSFTSLPSFFLRTRPLEKALREFFSRARVSAAVDRTNPAATVSQARWLASVEPDATSSKRSGFALDDIEPSQLGLLCPIEPWSGRGPVGSSLALGARIGALGRLEGRFDFLSGGVASRRFADALALADAPVTAGEERAASGLVGALTAASVTTCEEGAVGWRLATRDGWVGAAAALVPFAAHDEATGWMGGVRNIREAIPGLRARPPRVRTDLDALVARASGACVRAPVDGVVERVSGGAVVLMSAEGERACALRSFEVSRGNVFRARVAVREGQRVEAGAVIAEGPGVASETLACGDDLLVALMPWAGFNDGCAAVVSERVVREARLTSAHVRVVTATVGRAHGGTHALSADVDDLDAYERATLDDDGLVRVGTRVREGDALIGRAHRRAGSKVASGDSVRAPRGCEGVVIRAELYRPDRRPKGTSVARVWVASRRALSVGDLVGSRHGDRGVVAKVAAEEDLPMLSDGRAVEAVLNPALVLEGHAGIVCEMRAAGGATPVEAPVTVSCASRFEGRDEPVELRDGRTGETFAARVCVGPLHLFKLAPLAADAFEARARGARDGRTRQPVDDASHAPGQMFDEDAVWALVAHGAAHALRETLGARGDDPRAAEALDRSVERGDLESIDSASQTFAAFLRTLQAAAIDVSAPRRRRR